MSHPDILDTWNSWDDAVQHTLEYLTLYDDIGRLNPEMVEMAGAVLLTAWINGYPDREKLEAWLERYWLIKGHGLDSNCYVCEARDLIIPECTVWRHWYNGEK